MIRVLQVVPCLALGGTEAFIMNIYRQVNLKDYQFDFMVFSNKYNEYTSEIKSKGGHIFYCGSCSIGDIHIFTKKAVEIMKQNGPYDVVHSHANIQNGIVLRAAYKAGIKKRISHSHDTNGKCYTGIRKIFTTFKIYLIEKYSTDLLACSIEAGNYLYGDSLFSTKGKMIFNGIDVSKFNLIGNEINKNIIDIDINDSLVIGNITRFENKKNTMFTIRVFNEIFKLNPKAFLVLGGPDGGELDNAIQLVKELNITDNVRFIGPRKDVPIWLNIIDIYLFPSLYEGLGIAFLEAQAAGCFCVASDSVPLSASIVDNSTLFISFKETAGEWSKTILNNYKNWIKPSNETIRKEFDNKGFSIEKSSRMMMEIYEKAEK